MQPDGARNNASQFDGNGISDLPCEFMTIDFGSWFYETELLGKGLEEGGFAD
jgi:hypothetical protein